MLPYPLRRDDHQLLTPPEWAKLLVLQALECCAQACSGGALGKGEIIIESDVLLLPQALAARERMWQAGIILDWLRVVHVIVA